MNAGANNAMPPLWLTCWAWLTVAAVLPLLFLGALVTTMKVGMADQRSVVSPLEAMSEMFGSEQSLGWKIEHAHRLAGWLAGLCGIGLAVGFFFGESGKFRWLGLLGLSLIAGQGLLGIFRVQLNALWGTDLAWIHGIFAQIVFAALVGIALVESPAWRRLSNAESVQPRSAGFSPPSPAPLRKWSLVCVGLVLGQLVLGGMIRHQPSLLIARVHIFGAFLVLACLLWLAKLAFDGGFRRTGWMLLALVALEITLGVETGVHWMARFFRPGLAGSETVPQMLTRTAHYVVGSLVFAATMVAALQAHPRRAGSVSAPDGTPVAYAPGSPKVPALTAQGGLA